MSEPLTDEYLAAIAAKTNEFVLVGPVAQGLATELQAARTEIESLKIRKTGYQELAKEDAQEITRKDAALRKAREYALTMTWKLGASRQDAYLKLLGVIEAALPDAPTLADYRGEDGAAIEAAKGGE